MPPVYRVTNELTNDRAFAFLRRFQDIKFMLRQMSLNDVADDEPRSRSG